jgi:MATE family multidrug resistance protein
MSLSSDATLQRQSELRKGSVPEVFDLAYPVVLTQMATTTMGVVDSAMVGRLGATELASVGFAGVWMWTIFSLFYGTASGVQTFVSQADGADEPLHCGPWAWQGAYAVVPVTLVVVVILGFLIGPLVSLLGPSPEMQQASLAYVKTRLPGEVGMAVLMVLTSFFRGLGDTRTPLYVSLGANALNAGLDYALIFGKFGFPEWGVAGAGAATAIGQWSAAGALFLAFRRRSLRARYNTAPAPPQRDAIQRFLRTGIPIGGQWALGMTSFAMFTTLIARMSDQAMAASQAFIILLSLSFMQAIGISVAASTLVGRYIGAKEMAGAERSFWSSLRLGAVLGGLVAVLYVMFPEALMRIFTNDPEVIALGAPLMLLGALFQFFDAGGIIAEGALRGAGDTRWPFVVHSLLGWGFFVPSAYVLGFVFEGGLRGAWFAGLLYVIALAAALVWRFRSGAWRKIEI